MYKIIGGKKALKKAIFEDYNIKFELVGKRIY